MRAWLGAVFMLLWAAAQGLARGNESGTGIDIEMPQDGHITVAIDDASGHRVRNLIADQSIKKGPQHFNWDGLDDDGRMLPAGDYHWVGLTRGDLHAIYRGAFTHGSPPWPYGDTGGWGADHAAATSVVSIGDRVIIGSHTTEGGSGILCADLTGKKIWGTQWLNRMVWAGADSLATDGERIYAGCIPGWLSQDAFRVWEIDPKTGKSWYVVTIPRTKSEQPPPAAPFDDVAGLRVVGARKLGASRWEGELYVCDVLGKQPRTFVYSTARATESDESGYDHQHMMTFLRVLPLRIWGLTWLSDGRCIAALDHTIAVLDTKTGVAKPLVAQGAVEAPFSITSDSKNRIYVSDWGGTNPPTRADRTMKYQSLRKSVKSSMQIKVFDSSGAVLRALGRPGGYGTPDGNHEDPGPVDPRDFFFPSQTAVDAKGQLWVTELVFQPKRVTIWSIPDDLGAQPAGLVKQLRGRPQYGEGVVMIDPQRPNLLLMQCQGVLWDVDIATQKYEHIERWYNSNLSDGLYSGIAVNRVRLGDRTFGTLSDFNFDQGVMGEVKGAGFRPLAFIGTMMGYNPWPEGMPEVLKKALLAQPGWEAAAKAAHIDPTLQKLKEEPDHHRWPAAYNGFIWTDANGDGIWQPEEIKFAELHYESTISWVFDRQMNALVNVGGHQHLMKLEGFNAIGAPQYDLAHMIPLDFRAWGHRPQIDPDGSILIPRGSDPRLRLIDANHRERWSYPVASNDGGYSAVPPDQIMKPGIIHGENGLQGVVPGPAGIGEVFMIHGWHGMNYLLTRDDGLFIGTVFKPHGLFKEIHEISNATIGMLMDDYSLGGENFGGSLARAEASVQGFEKGHYYILGYSFNMVIELAGMDSVHRLPGGSTKLTDETVAQNRAQIIAQAQARKKSSEQYAGVDLLPGAENLVEIGLPNPNWFNARMQLWYTPKGLGVRAICGAVPGSLAKPELVFTSDAAEWQDAFTHGDAMEIQLQPDVLVAPDSPDQKSIATAGPQGIVFTQINGKPVVVRYRRMPAQLAPEGAKILNIGRDGTTVWVAEKLDVITGNVQRQIGLQDCDVTLNALLPWSTLGMTYSENLRFKANFGGVWKQITGRPDWRATVVGDIGAAQSDPASQLDMHPELWETVSLRPAGYTPPPDVTHAKIVGSGKPLEVRMAPQGPGEPASYADAFTWASGTKQGLRLKWYVAKDDSPLVNGGKDWTSLFKSGDGCDFQIDSPLFGKCRYFMTVFQGKPVIVRYVYNTNSRDDDFAGDTLASKWRNMNIEAGEVADKIHGGKLTLTAKSSPMAPEKDSCHLLAQPASGDFDVSLNIEGLAQETGSAGLMVRENNHGNARAFYLQLLAKEHPVISAHSRAKTGENAASLAEIKPDAGKSKFMRILRHADTFSAYFSDDGQNWAQLGDSAEIALPEKVFVGPFISGEFSKSSATVAHFHLKDQAAPAGQAVDFASPVSSFHVPSVELLKIAPVIERGQDWYTLEVTLPWNLLGVEPENKVAAELGVLRSDGPGTKTVRRDYWHTGLSLMVQDVPTEVHPTENWGLFEFKNQ